MPVPEPRPGMTGVATVLRIVMAGPDPAIQTPGVGDWIPGIIPGLDPGTGHDRRCDRAPDRHGRA